MKKIITSLLAASTFFLADAQQVINLLTGEVREGSDAAEPVVKVDTIENGYLVNYAYSEAILKQDHELPDCIMWSYPGYMVSDMNGTPSYLFKKGWVSIDNYTILIEIVDSCYVDFNYQLAPAYPAQPISPYSQVIRKPITPCLGFSPDVLIEKDEIRRVNGVRQLFYIVYPIQYNYEQQIIRAYTKISVKITLSGGTTGVKMPLANTPTIEPFTLDGRVATDGARGIVVRGGKKIISNHK